MQPVDSRAFTRRRPSQEGLARSVVVGGVALTCVPLVCAWFILRGTDVGSSVDPIVTAQATVAPATTTKVASMEADLPTGSIPPARSAAPAEPVVAAKPIAAPVAAKPVAAEMVAAAKPAAPAHPKPAGPNVVVAMLDPAYSFGAPPGTLSANPPGQLDYRFAAPVPREVAPPTAPDVRPPAADVRRAVQGAPLPLRKPSEPPQSSNPPVDHVVQGNKILSSTVAPKPTIFDKLFGKPKEPEIALAYASPDGGVLSDGTSTTPGRYDQWTAVYDISAHTVYLPDGTKLEAHSGLGPMLDNPNFTHVRMRGATPAHVYDLEPRPVLFHGVQAIRLKPVGGEAAIFNRNGILAHTYMLGPRGESNGCVSFKNYAAFLRAYQNHEIKRLAVVARLD